MTAIPLGYTLASLRARWPSALVAVVGIAGTVAVFVAMLALARGFQAAMLASGSPDNAIVRRAGATSEMYSVFGLEQLRAVEDATVVARADGVPLVSGEVVVVAALPLRATGTDANVQVRGVTPRVLKVRPQLRVTEGRFFRAGMAEVVVGSHARHSYAGLELGMPLRFGGREWQVVGILDAGGSAFDSEIWCDADLLNAAYQRPLGIVQSATVRLRDAAELGRLQATLAQDPRLTVEAESEVAYYERESRLLRGLILGLGLLVAGVMGVGAVFGALNTMYSAVAERSREVATLRALGFGGGAVVLAFVVEALLISLVGGALGCVAVLPVNGLTTGTMNWSTFAHLAFAFRITPGLLGVGLGFAVAMGLLGGLPPAIRAARLPVAAALREL
jgi:putative ABC transport system permease protein